MTQILDLSTSTTIDRDTAIVRIREALRRRSGKAWSVTGGRGTAWGWITIEAPPARRTWGARLKAPHLSEREPGNWEPYDTGQPGRSMSPAEEVELAGLLGLERICGSEKIPARSDYYREYVDRAEGRTPSVEGKPYWD